MQTIKILERKDNKSQREVRSFQLEIRAAEDGTVEGYGSVFDVQDSYADVIEKGAFAKSISTHKSAKSMPAMLWQHDSSQPIGVWTSMSEDDNGLRVTGRLAMDTVKGKDAHALLKMGALNGLSIGFMTKQYRYDEETDIRTLTEVDLWEVSLVTFPANTQARVTQVKSADDLQTLKDAERILRDSGFSKQDALAFVSRVKTLASRSDSDEDMGGLKQALLALRSTFP
jgi:HK97 family phage prohead protease